MAALKTVAVMAGPVIWRLHLQRALVGSGHGFHPRQSSLFPPRLMVRIGTRSFRLGSTREILGLGLRQ